MSFFTALFFSILLCGLQDVSAGSKGKAKAKARTDESRAESKADSSAEMKKIADYQLLSITTWGDTNFTHIIFIFDSGIPEHSMKEAKYHGMPVITLRLSSTDFDLLKVPHADRPVYHIEPVHSEQYDTSMVNIRLYLERKIMPEILEKENKIQWKFPGVGLPERVWPYQLERITDLSSNPFKLSLRIELDEMPEVKRVFLNKDKKKVIVVLNNTFMDSSRISAPVIPFINDVQMKHVISDKGVAYSKLIFSSNFKLIFTTIEDNYRIFINLQKEAVLKHSKWYK